MQENRLCLRISEKNIRGKERSTRPSLKFSGKHSQKIRGRKKQNSRGREGGEGKGKKGKSADLAVTQRLGKKFPFN